MENIMKLDLVERLSLSDLMELRVAVTNEVNKREEDAQNCLIHGETYPGYALSEPRQSRVIIDQDTFQTIIGNSLGDNSYKIVPLSMTAAEALIKKSYSTEDAQEILDELAPCYGTKLSIPKLVYVGEENDE